MGDLFQVVRINSDEAGTTLTLLHEPYIDPVHNEPEWPSTSQASAANAGQGPHLPAAILDYLHRQIGLAAIEHGADHWQEKANPGLVAAARELSQGTGLTDGPTTRVTSRICPDTGLPVGSCQEHMQCPEAGVAGVTAAHIPEVAQDILGDAWVVCSCGWDSSDPKAVSWIDHIHDVLRASTVRP